MIQAKDVTDLLKSVTSLLRKIVYYIITAIRQYFLLGILLFCSSIAGCYYYQHTMVPYFESEMSCEINNMSKKTYGEMLQKIELLADTRSYETLAKTLNITASQSQDIIAIKARNISGMPLYEDVTTGLGPIYIKLKSKHNSAFAPVQKGLLTYLNGSPFRKNRNEWETTISIKKARCCFTTWQ